MNDEDVNCILHEANMALGYVAISSNDLESVHHYFSGGNAQQAALNQSHVRMKTFLSVILLVIKAC